VRSTLSRTLFRVGSVDDLRTRRKVRGSKQSMIVGVLQRNQAKYDTYIPLHSFIHDNESIYFDLKSG
jgi:hypothetical protein